MAASEPRPRRRATPWQVVKAVASGFFGVRSSRKDDEVEIRPVQIIIVGILGAALFVAILLLLVNFILSRIGTGA
jgi:hypothetical protein